MTDVHRFATSLEAEVKKARSGAGADICGLFADLEPPVLSAINSVTAFLGCPTSPSVEEVAIEKPFRICLIRALLLRILADTPDPRWSSTILEGLVEAAQGVAGSETGDVIVALFEILDENEVELTGAVANMSRQLARLCFISNSDFYERSDFSAIVERLTMSPLPATAYLALQVLPPRYEEDVKATIMEALSTTAYAGEAFSVFGDDQDGRVVRRYKYIGPKDLLAAVSSNTEGSVIRSFVDFREWLSIYEKEALEEPFTFVVDVEGNLRLAPRRTEHVACAGRADVLSAGEIWFEPELDGWTVREVSNQSIGYCPDIDSWTEVARAIDRIGLRRPDAFTYGFIFRYCGECRMASLIKDDDFICAMCGRAL